MSIQVRLKGYNTLVDVLESFEEDSTGNSITEQGTEGILYNPAVIDSLPAYVEIVEFKEYELGTAIGVRKPNGATTYISYKWVSSLRHKGTSYYFSITGLDKVGDKYLKIANGFVIDTTSMSIVTLSSLPICSECGSMADEEVDGVKICSKCITEKYTKLNSYSYKPSPIFIGEHLKGDVDSKVYYGIELEYGLNGKKEMGKLVFKNKDKVYLKSDASIEGGDFHAELVSHPHTFKALMSDDSYLSALSSLKVEEHRETNGCHIHISRSAFIDNKHYAKWYFLMHEMKSINEYVGGRSLTRYCTFKPEGTIGKKYKNYKGQERSLMINECNDNTVECRFFSSTNDGNEVRMFVQYLESLIKYTKYSDDAVTIAGWKVYVDKYSAKYNFLSTKLKSYSGSFSGGIVYKAPVVKNMDMTQFPLALLNKVSSITLKNGKVYRDVDIHRVGANNILTFYYDNRNSNTEVAVDEILSFSWEE